MIGRRIPAILGKGWGLPGIGPPPALRPFMGGFGTVMALVGVSFIIFVCAGSPLLHAVFF